jgi:hypothetical protein
MSFVTGTLKITQMELHTTNTFIWAALQKYLQIILTFNNNFVFTFVTSVFGLDFLKHISKRRRRLRICLKVARIY